MFSSLRTSFSRLGGIRNVSLSTTVAVVLSGSGVYDGSEVHEASAVMVNLSRKNAEYKIFAPDKPQMHTINHTNGEDMQQERNVLIESARIARGKIAPLSELQAADHDAVIFPGGFGAAKNLSTFATQGADMAVDPQVEKVMKDFHEAGKPIGLCCIAPVLAAKVFPGVELTMGEDTEQEGKYPYAGACGAAVTMGAKHINHTVNEVQIDETNRIVTTPAFMCETAIHEVHDGVGAMVEAVLKLTS